MIDQPGRIGTPSQVQSKVAKQQPGRTGEAGQFGKMFEKEIRENEDLKFSIHAQERIRFRNISMTVNQIERLKSGVNKLADKGGRESLVLMDSSAFLVSINNRTVITAIGGEQLRDNVFTNIDSAIII